MMGGGVLKQARPLTECDLTELRVTGFAALIDGRIHSRCYECGLRESNIQRAPTDPPNAALVESLCERCLHLRRYEFSKPVTFYFDEEGAEV